MDQTVLMNNKDKQYGPFPYIHDVLFWLKLPIGYISLKYSQTYLCGHLY